VHVLKHPEPIVGDGDPQVLLEPGIPRRREVGGRERPGDELLLELEPQDDVHAVGDLVGVDADE
jgi:hypothetical protein